MSQKSMVRRVLIFVAFTISSFLLSACFKARISIDVKPDETGTVGFAIGMTSQAKALVASQGGGDPMQSLSKSLSENPNNPNDVKITRWTEGEYEWVQGEIAFKNLSDLNERMSKVDYFESFSIKRQIGIVKDKYILNARLKPLSEDSGSSEIDPSAFIEIQMSVHLPGDVIETNGVFDGKESSNMIWTINSKQTTTAHVASEVQLAFGSVLFGRLHPKADMSHNYNAGN